MSAGREDLARAVLERKQLITAEIESLDQQVAELESEQQRRSEQRGKSPVLLAAPDDSVVGTSRIRS